MSCYESNTLNQSVTPFSNVSNSIRHGSTSARAWEDGVDEVLLQTNCSIEKLMEMQRPRQDLNKYSQLTGRTRARSTSVSRLTSSASTKEADLSSMAALEQKVDFMYRRIKMLDDKVKSMEKEKLDNRNFSIDTMSAIRHIADAQAADQKQIFLLKESAMSLKSGLEVLNRREKEMLEAKTLRAGDVDQDEILEAVTKVIKMNFRTKIKDATEKIAIEYAKRAANLSEKSAAEIEKLRFEKQRFELQTIPVIETELRGVISEFERLKGRQNLIDDSYRSLENAVALREKKAEESHKKAHRLHKKELSTMMDAVGKRLNEQLTLSRSQVGDHPGSHGFCTQRLCVVEAFQKEQSSQLKECSSMSKEALNVARECQVDLTRRTLQNTSALPGLQKHSRHSLELVVEELHNDIRGMKSLYSNYELASTVAVDSLTASNRKMKGKINELSAGMASLSSIREAVETLLVEVHHQTKGDHIPKGDHSPKGDGVINVDHSPKGDHIIVRDYGPKGDNVIDGDYGPKGDLKNTFMGIHARLESLERNAFNHEKKDSYKSPQLMQQNDLVTLQTNESLPNAVLEYIEDEISRVQADLEDAVNTGWVDVMARNMAVAQDGAKLSDLVQVLQSTVISIQSEQQGLIKRVITLESDALNDADDAVSVQELSVTQTIKRPPSSHPSTHPQRKGENLFIDETATEGQKEEEEEEEKEEEIMKATEEGREEETDDKEEKDLMEEEEEEDVAEEQASVKGLAKLKELPALEPLYVRIGLHESSFPIQQSTLTSESSGSSFSLTSHLIGIAHQTDCAGNSVRIQSILGSTESTDRTSCASSGTALTRTNLIPTYLHVDLSGSDVASSPGLITPLDSTSACIDASLCTSALMDPAISSCDRASEHAVDYSHSATECVTAFTGYDVAAASVSVSVGEGAVTATSSSASPLSLPSPQLISPSSTTITSTHYPIPGLMNSGKINENNINDDVATIIKSKDLISLNNLSEENVLSSTSTPEEKLFLKKNEHRS